MLDGGADLRVVQELLSNTLKHAKADEVSIQLFKNKAHLVLIVEDNGVGIQPDDLNGKGMGLTNITTRIQTLNGSYSFDSGPNKGTVTSIRIPLKSV